MMAPYPSFALFFLTMLRASLQLWQSLSCAKIVIVGQRSQKEGQEPKTQSKPKQNLKTTTTPSNRNVLDQSSKGEIRRNNLRLSRQSTISGSTFSAENSQKLHVNEHSLFTRKLQGWSWWRNHQSWVCAVLQACHAIVPVLCRNVMEVRDATDQVCGWWRKGCLSSSRNRSTFVHPFSGHILVGTHE